jgi:sporulation-control protein spo0M
MCYFEQNRWNCGFWKWGQFRQQCTKEHQTGETCGLKLVYVTIDDPDKCKLCYDIDKKERRLDKMRRDIARWYREGNRTATIAATQSSAEEVQIQINSMIVQHRNRASGE